MVVIAWSDNVTGNIPFMNNAVLIRNFLDLSLAINLIAMFHAKWYRSIGVTNSLLAVSTASMPSSPSVNFRIFVFNNSIWDGDKIFLNVASAYEKRRENNSSR